MWFKRISSLWLKRLFIVITVSTLCFILLYDEWESSKSSNSFLSKSLSNESKRIDWHDYDFISYENSRIGPGERSGFNLTDPIDIEENKFLFDRDGCFVLVSDTISVTRSIQEVRDEVCKTRKYLAQLPSVSVVVVYYDEALTVLLRCLFSIYNRSPRDLLHEIILINDYSTDYLLYLPLRYFISKHFTKKVKIFNNPSRLGLIVSRMEGARRASGDVIVFLDSHMEVTTNWLPPLLEPIALDRTTATVPCIDAITYDSFEYKPSASNLDGGFDWNLRYHYFILPKDEYPVFGENHQLAVMTGGAYAIDRQYFFELGGYDEGMFLFNGENYEMSLKLHLCGGNLLKVPCSRVGHLNRLFHKYSSIMNGIDYSTTNLRRLVEVWFDEFKFLFYRNHPERLQIDPGDLTNAISVKERLNCKPFKYYLDEVAPKILTHFPIEEQPNFASGAIRSKAGNFCLETYGENNDRIYLQECSRNLTSPSKKQYFTLTWHRTIKRNMTNDDNCLGDGVFYECLYQPNDQIYRFSTETKQLINLGKLQCLQANTQDYSVSLETCSLTDVNQKWDFGHKNLTALNNWESWGMPLWN